MEGIIKTAPAKGFDGQMYYSPSVSRNEAQVLGRHHQQQEGYLPSTTTSVRTRTLLVAITTLFLLVMVGLILDMVDLIEPSSGKVPQGSKTKTFARSSARGSDEVARLRVLAINANQALSNLSDDFNTAFSTADTVLGNGFPYSWDVCTLPVGKLVKTAGNRTSEPFRITIVGGSSTALSPKNCSIDPSDKLGGRYSNILAQEIAHDFITTSRKLSSTTTATTATEMTAKIEVTNLAHGSTDSLWSALTMDEVLGHNQSKSNVDLLVWEFATNDALLGTASGAPRRTSDNMARMMDVWLWRVYLVFEKHPPPIMLVYLWDCPSDRTGHMVQSAYLAGKRIVEHYRQAGWRISVINVGGAVHSNHSTAPSPESLLRDSHHPSCNGMHLITAMIRHVMYTDILKCQNETEDFQYNHPRDHRHDGSIAASLEPMTKSQLNTTDPSTAILRALLGPQTIGSLMQWTPQSGDSQLHVLSKEDVHSEQVYGSRVVETRNDRKVSYSLERCLNLTSFIVREPTLEWLGIGVGGGLYAKNGYYGQIKLDVNHIPANLSRRVEDSLYRLDMDERIITGKLRANFVTHWIHVPEITNAVYPVTDGNTTTLNETTAPTDYELEVCYYAAEESRCPFYNATTVEQACALWLKSKNLDGDSENCSFKSVNEACFQWYQTKEGLALAEKYGAWVGGWGKGSPQLNWIIGIKD
jgi:hypothetical protein